MRLLLSISQYLSRYTSLFIIIVAIIAFIVPETFAWVQQGQRASVILGLIMLTMGCTLSTKDFRILLSRPIDILIGTAAQYTIMPIVAWGLARIFHLDAFMTAGIIRTGSSSMCRLTFDLMFSIYCELMMFVAHHLTRIQSLL